MAFSFESGEYACTVGTVVTLHYTIKSISPYMLISESIGPFSRYMYLLRTPFQDPSSFKMTNPLCASIFCMYNQLTFSILSLPIDYKLLFVE